MTYAKGQGLRRDPRTYCDQALGAAWVGRYLREHITGNDPDERRDSRALLIDQLYTALRAIDIDAPVPLVVARLAEIRCMKLTHLAYSQAHVTEPKPLAKTSKTPWVSRRTVIGGEP